MAHCLSCVLVTELQWPRCLIYHFQWMWLKQNFEVITVCTFVFFFFFIWRHQGHGMARVRRDQMKKQLTNVEDQLDEARWVVECTRPFSPVQPQKASRGFKCKLLCHPIDVKFSTTKTPAKLWGRIVSKGCTSGTLLLSHKIALCTDYIKDRES